MPEQPGQISTLSSYVPQTVLRDLGLRPSLPTEPHGESFPAALLLIDITGFTPLTASAAQEGAAGTEHLSRELNGYLGGIIDLVVEHGGDIAKIVGDALIPVWRAGDEDLATVTRRAVGCGQAIANRFGEAALGAEMPLAVKVGVCAGELSEAHVGGEGGRWLFMITGEAVLQLSELERHLETGEVVASPEAWALVRDRLAGQQLTDGYVRLRPADLAASLPPPEPAAPASVNEQVVRAYIPPVLLSRLEAGQAEWLAELRQTSAAFVNVRGVVDAAMSSLPLLHQLAQLGQRVIGRYDGWLKEITMDDKGTTLIAIFGIPPFTHEDDPGRAVSAALALQAQIRELGLSAAVGVTTGTTFCAPVGNDRRRDFAMLGQHVNLAARLMQASGTNGVLTDAATAERARVAIPFEHLPAYVLKGSADPIDVYRARTPAPADRPASLIDRVAELAEASAMLEALKAGAGAVVLLEGEPGIGKSRLLAEWLREAHAAGVRTVTGSGAEIDVGTAYHAWRGVFEHLLGLGAVTDRATRRRLVLDRLGSDAESLRLAPLLEAVLSLDLADNEATAQMAGEVRADNTRDLLIRILSRHAGEAPLMVAIDDAQWLDSASRSLVLRVRKEIPNLLTVLAMRPTGMEPESVPVADDTRSVRLGALAPNDAASLVAERTGAGRLAEPVATLVQDRAEGNPLFIEQLTYALRDSGRIVVDNGLLRTTSGSEAVEVAIIPDTVQRVITTRIDQLPPDQALALKVASVIGPRFAVRTLVEVYPLPVEPSALVDSLEALVRLDLVAPVTPAPEPTYEFRHKITQEVAYNLMPPAQSEQLHQRVAEWHESAYADDLSRLHALLAHHWGRARMPARGVDHLEAAGAEALRTFANEEAITFLGQALSMADESRLKVDDSRRGVWHLQLGEAHVHQSRYREGREHLELGLRLLRRPVPRTRWQQVLSLSGELFAQLLKRAGLGRRRRLNESQRAEMVATFRAYERLAEASYYGRETLLPLYCTVHILNEAEASGIPSEMARGFAGTGALFGLVPLSKIAEWYLGRALERLEEVDDLTAHEIIRIVIGYYHTGVGHWDVAREQLGTVRRTARGLGDRRRLQDALGNLMEVEYLQGFFAPAADLGAELVKVAVSQNDRRFEAEGLVGRAYTAFELGRLDVARRGLESMRTLEAAEPFLPDELRIKWQGASALLHLGLDDRAKAVAAAEEAMRLTAGGRPTYFATFLGYAAPAEVHLHLLESGVTVGDSSRRAAKALERLGSYASVFPIGRARHATLTGCHAWLLGQHTRAQRSWRRGLAIATELGMRYDKALAHREIGRHLDAGDPERAKHLDAARELFSELGAARALAQLDRADTGA